MVSGHGVTPCHHQPAALHLTVISIVHTVMSRTYYIIYKADLTKIHGVSCGHLEVEATDPKILM